MGAHLAGKGQTMIGRWETLGLLVAALLGSALGCSQGHADVDVEPESVVQGIINGNDASDPTFDAVGALATADGMDIGCSATLIAPKAVVTAKHCVEKLVAPALESGAGKTVMFGAWLDQEIAITGYVVAEDSSTSVGLLENGGRDVAVVYLESAPVGITPAKLGQFKNCMVGTQFQVAGWGKDQSGYAGWRFAGPATARALHGRWYELLFNGDKQAYLDWYWADAVSSNKTKVNAQQWWKSYRLEAGYELLAGGLPGEALGCFGDSGGPLYLGDTPETLTLYGVSFAAEASMADICTRGAAYLVFNKTMLAFVQSAISDQ